MAADQWIFYGGSLFTDFVTGILGTGLLSDRRFDLSLTDEPMETR